MALGAFAMTLPPRSSRFSSAETVHKDLSPAVLQPGSEFRGEKVRVGGRLWSPSKRHAPCILSRAVAGNCLAGVTGPWGGMEEG